MHKTLITYTILVLAACSLLPACKEAVPRQIKPAFYYWRSEFRLQASEKKYLSGIASPDLYIRFFDVVWDPQTAQPVPAAPLHFAEHPDSTLTYVPVVFITNETLQHCSLQQMSSLSAHILEKVKSLSGSFAHGYTQLQVDCDWTASTREKYFLLLQLLGKQLHPAGIRLSATLRLHQVKYAGKTGVPPADRCMLMFYNMGDWQNPQVPNSMYDLQIAGKYLSHIKSYPLPLDVALPLLRWTIVYRRGRFLTFLNYIAADELDHCDFLEKLPDDNRFIVKKDTLALGCAFRKNDVLRSETCDTKALLEGKEQLLRRIRNTGLTLALFHLDRQLLNHYTDAQIQKLFSPLP